MKYPAKKKVKLQGGVSNSHQEATLSVGNNSYYLKLDWRSRLSEWSVSIMLDGESLVEGATLNPGVNLFDGLFGCGGLYCFGDQPTLDNLGSDSFLIWVSDEEMISRRKLSK